MTGIKLSHATPIFACADVEAALALCAERLGFERAWVWGDPPSDGGARRDDVSLLFRRNAELGERARGTEVMVFVRNVDALYAEHQARGAPIVSALEDKPWDLREYTVELPPGYLLRFAEGLEYVREREA
ncbi:MAG TPA: VOC family protein [Thermoanaerobaculia bacterium]